MRMPGYSAEIAAPSIARRLNDVVVVGPNGPIVIEGDCECTRWEPVCFEIGGWCFFGHCLPGVEICVDVCRSVRCSAF